MPYATVHFSGAKQEMDGIISEQIEIQKNIYPVQKVREGINISPYPLYAPYIISLVPSKPASALASKRAHLVYVPAAVPASFCHNYTTQQHVTKQQQ
jgi:hypothetical protein